MFKKNVYELFVSVIQREIGKITVTVNFKTSSFFLWKVILKMCG